MRMKDANGKGQNERSGLMRGWEIEGV